MIDALSDPDSVWAPTDDAVLRAVDDVCADVYVSDGTWADLTATREYPEIIELLFVIGYYRMMAGFLNSVGVQVRAGMPALGQHAGPRPNPVTPSTGPTRESSGRTGADGTWNRTFEHPAGSQAVVLRLHTSDGTVTGSMRNEQQGFTVPIVDGTVEGSHLDFSARMTEPIQIDLSVEGAVDGDRFTGTVVVGGGGTFPLAGWRAV